MKKFNENVLNDENLPNSIQNEPEEAQVGITPTDMMDSNWTQSVDTFEELGLKKNLLRGVYGYGFEKPSPIQQKAIIPIIKGNDVIAQAQSGTGKTGAFSIGTLELIDPNLNEVQVLIMAPTRELAGQIAAFYQVVGEFLKVKVALLIGGTQVRSDVEKLQKGVHVVVGCPGRVLDMIEKKILNLTYCKAFVLDEADEMLSKGFLEKIKVGISYIAPTTKVLLFSATMPEEIVKLTEQFMQKPVKIMVKKEKISLEGIKQYYVLMKKEDKLEILVDIYRNIEINQAVIYCNNRSGVEHVAEELTKLGHKVSAIHGDKPMLERDTIMKDFRSGATRVLVSTDLLARGIDIQALSLVVNYELPRDKETYIHRIGRTGRLGKKGNAINFVTPDQKEDLDALMKFYDINIEKLPSDLSEIK